MLHISIIIIINNNSLNIIFNTKYGGSDDVIEKIKDFNYKELTKEQELLIDELILNERIKRTL